MRVIEQVVVVVVEVIGRVRVVAGQVGGIDQAVATDQVAVDITMMMMMTMKY